MAMTVTDYPVRKRITAEEMRAKILEVAEEQFSRAGFNKTSVGDIAAKLGMSAANIYRFFPSRDAINYAICERILGEIEQAAMSVAETNARASDKLEKILWTIHEYNRMKLLAEPRLYSMIIVAVREDWHVIRPHLVRMQLIFEGILREGNEAGEFDLDDPAEAARAIRAAFSPFIHPVMLDHSAQHGECGELGLREQLRFIRRALVRSF